jgi:hypothetical protein
MVPRQHEWHDGDPIMPVRLSREKVARADTLQLQLVVLNEKEFETTIFNVELLELN